MKQLKRFLILPILLISFWGTSQNYLGIYGSNYSGVMGTDINPASFVDGRFMVDVNLFSFNTGTWTDAAKFDTKDMPKWWIKSFKADDPIPGDSSGLIVGGSNPYNDWMIPDSTFTDRYITRSYDENSSKPIGAYSNIQIDILNFMFHINPKIAIGVAVKGRMIANLDEVDPKLAVLAENSLDYPSLWNTTFNEQLLSVNQQAWMEYGFIYSQVIKDDGEHFMKVGGKAKWLSGYTAAYVNTDNFSYNLINSDTSASLKGDFSYGYSTGTLEELNDGNLPANPKSASKFGLGLDLGFVYEWRPDWKEYKYDMDGETNIWRRDQDKYKIRAGASILDIGGMKYEKGGLSRDFSVDSDTPFDLTVFDDAEGLVGFDSIIDSLILNDPGWTSNEEAGNTFFMSTPTVISLQFDYHIWKYFYVNATSVINILSKKKPHRVRVPNQFSVTPSFDMAWYGVHLPMSYNKYSGFKAGVGARLGPLTIGITDYRVLFATGKVRGAEMYVGLRVPILYTHPSDIDGDLVSDELDECLVVQGLWEFKGCPDTDRDGIKDMDDDCPLEAGLPEYNGCPDRDNDSIPDKDDACPDVPGLRKFNGCPDTDGDGIIDEEDACPKVPGPIENQGCPDTDGDGIFDFVDGCPEVFGPEENNGCPWPDTDGDGLLDKEDACPYLAGPIENEGCPYLDTDGDTVFDKDDDCPNTPGLVELKGCPQIEEEIIEILKTAFDNLEFETGKDVIKISSYESLTELAEVLVKKTDWKLQIAGHTDNVGSAQSNLVLSKKRSEAVKQFMISKGIDASRLSALYFGETDPVEDNSTKEGRQKNRRVEMTIIFN